MLKNKIDQCGRNEGEKQQIVFNSNSVAGGGVRRRAGGGWRGSRATNCKSTSGWAKRVGGFSDRQMEGQRLAKTQLPAAAPQFSLHQPQAAQRAATLELPESLIMQPFRETTQKK